MSAPERRRARLLSGMILVLLAATIFPLILFTLLTSTLPWQDPIMLVTGCVAVALAAAYRLNRLGRSRAGMALTVGVVALAIWAIVLVNRSDVGTILGIFPYAVVSVLLGSLLLSARATTLLALGHLAGGLLLLAFDPRLAATDFGDDLWFVGITSLLILLAAALRQQDRTQIEQQTQALAENEARYRLATRATNDAIWDWNIVTDRVVWNENVQVLFGYPPAEVGPDAAWWSSRIHPEDQARILSGVQAALEGGSQVWSDEYRFRRADGAYALVMDRGFIVFDERGRAVRMIGSMTDITERRQVETALRQAEVKYRTLVEQLPAITYVVEFGEVNRTTYISPQIESLLGFSPQEWLADPGLWVKQIHPDDRDPMLAEVRRKDQLGEALDLEYRVLTREGHTLWFQNQSVLVRDEAGQPRYSHGLMFDITGRKRAEAALHASELRFRELFEKSPDAIFVEDFDGQVLDVNPAGCRLNDMPYAEIVGTNVLELIPADIREAAARDFAKMVAGEITYLESLSRTKAGHVVPVEIRVSHIQYADRPALLLQVRDITERKRAEAALRESSERYRQMFEEAERLRQFTESIAHTMAEGLAVEDVEGRFTLVNPQMQAILGYAPDELVGQHWSKIVAPQDRGLVAEQSAQRASGVTSVYETRLLAKNGREVPVLISAAPLLREGKFSGTVVTFADISEREQAEEALRQANEELRRGLAELEQRNREIALLNEMSSMLQACSSAEEASSVIANVGRQLFPEDVGAVYVTSASRDVVEAAAVWGPFSPVETGERVFAAGECWALRRGRPHVVAEGAAGLLCQHVGAPPPTAYLCLPMMAQGEAIGLLHLRLPRGPHEPPSLGEAKQRLAQTVGDSVALALANLNLRETLKNQSIRDPLTGLFNRRYMEESLARELLRAARDPYPIGILMLDIDRFKQFNDTFGHAAGDTLLRELGAFLTAHIRGGDIACRYGGEEFTIILPETPLEVALRRAEHLRQEVRHLVVQHRGQALGSITLSLGVALFPDHGATAEAVLRAADEALYRAKHEGRDRVVVAQ